MLSWKTIFVLALLCTATVSIAQDIKLTEQQDRWVINADGSIQWNINGRLPHSDHIEMSGEKVSLWVQYGVDTSGKQAQMSGRKRRSLL